MKIFIVCFCIFFFKVFSSIAQVNTPTSIDIPLTDALQGCFVLPLPDKEFLVFLDEKRINMYSSLTQVTKYDSLLNPVWQQKYVLNFNIANNGFEIIDNKLYTYLMRKDSLYKIAVLDLAKGKFESIECRFILDDTFRDKYFVALSDAFFFAEEKKKYYFIVHHYQPTNQSKLLSNINFYKLQLMDMKTHQASNTMGATLSESDGYYFYLYDNEGSMIFNQKVRIEDPKRIFINFNVYIKNKEEQYVMGLFGRNILKPQGIYVSSFKNRKYTGTVYHGFNQFANFHHHLPQNQQEKIQKQIKQKGSYYYDYFFSKQHLKEINGQLVYTVQLYQNRNTRKNSHEITVICNFDKSLNLLWNNTFNHKYFPEKLFFAPVFVGLGKEDVSVLTLGEKILYLAQTQRDAPFKEIKERNTPFPKLTSVFTRFDVQHWYNEYFLLTGLVSENNQFFCRILKVK